MEKSDSSHTNLQELTYIVSRRGGQIRSSHQTSLNCLSNLNQKELSNVRRKIESLRIRKLEVGLVSARGLVSQYLIFQEIGSDKQSLGRQICLPKVLIKSEQKLVKFRENVRRNSESCIS